MKLHQLFTRFSVSAAVFSILAAILPPLRVRAATNYTESFLPGPPSGHSFGRSLDIYQDTLAVGLSLSPESGGVYSYKRVQNDWQHTATLDITAEPGDDDFGAGVALDDFLLVGAPHRNSSFVGTVYFFRPQGTNWLPPVPMFPPNDSVAGRFGASVARSGSLIAIAAPAEVPGAVYVYESFGDPTWHLEARLTSSNAGQKDDSFSRVELSGNTLLVDSGDDAYVFVRTGTNWNFQARLAPPTTNSLPGSTALDQNVAVVNGFVFVRHGSHWLQSQKLLPSPATSNFGRSAAIEGNTIVVGAWNTFYLASTHGTAFVFQFDGSSWRQIDQLTPSWPGASGEFGKTLSIDQGTILAGDPNHIQNDILTPTGAVYVWTPLGGAPSPAAAATDIYNGFVVGINLTDPGAGYTYPPWVRLVGGGGTGASAVATVVSNRVESIEIVNSGSGYTSAPTVVIQCPAEGPGASEFLDLRVSYAAVTFDLTPGKRYSLESSFDHSTWTALGEPFIAQQETLTEEFPVEQTGRFFRLVEIGASLN